MTWAQTGGAAAPAPVTLLVIVGQVVKVTEGKAWAPGEDNLGGDGSEVPFNHPRALWKTVHAEVEVDDNGQLRLPCAPDRVSEHLLAETSTLDELRQAADDPVQVRHVKPLVIA